MTRRSPEAEVAHRIARLAVEEDGREDITSAVAVAKGTRAEARVECRTDGVVAGLAFADAVAEVCSTRPADWLVREGDEVRAGTVLGTMSGDLARLLRAERPMLNLLQRAVGIATATRAYVDAVRGTSCRVLHTRKTAPGLRALDIAAVLAGGGAPHRADLARTVMVKDNHWRALELAGRSLADALAEARKRKIEGLQVEVESVQQLETACRAGATRLLVDNQLPATVADWAARARALAPGIEIEATGGITLANVREYADAGADYVSIGALTHSVTAGDVAIEIAGT
ncbi:MAG TPA: carboxylating nicotinate-nucleotide diphosphorylase [Gemmatimonadales bacterium]